MSNCVRIETPAVWFRPTELDIPRLQKWLAAIPPWTQQTLPRWDGALEAEETMWQVHAWWFLQANCGPLPDGGFVVRFGMGRSEYTFRDLRGTVELLRRFMLRPKTKVITCRDESDGFRRAFKMTLDFGKGEIHG